MIAPHYLRFVAALATVASSACSQSVGPSDGAVVTSDTTDVTATSDANPSQCPPSQPASGSPCTVADLRCTYPPANCGNTVLCNSVLFTWEPDCVAGPLAPPDLSA